jgi:N-acetylmuramic acid 6-phosphate etherase
MILLGRVYDGLMVDVQASNKKLVRRSGKILSRLTGRGDEEIHEALQQTGGSVKLAFLLLQGFGLGEAEAALDQAEGHLRRAMSLIVERSKGTGLRETPPSFREHATHE